MRPADEIKEKIGRMNFTADEKMRERMFEDVLAARNDNQKRNLSRNGLSVWRIIMESKMSKFAAAAVIFIVTVVGISLIDTNHGVSWAKVVEQLNLHERYKCRERVVREKGPQRPTMDVYHLNLSQRRQEVENGDIHIIDMRGTDAITVELSPSKKKATVTKLLGFGPRKDPAIIDMVKRFEQVSTERLGTKKKDGKVLHGFRHQPNEYNDFTVWVDGDTKLPVEIELKHIKHGQTIFLDEFEFDFELDPSAFSTEVPEGYEVRTIINDYRPVEPEEIAPEDVKLNHTSYKVGKLPWVERSCTIKDVSPLGSKDIVYKTGMVTEDGNTIVMAQGEYYNMEAMVWIPQQQLVLETTSGIKVYTHPNGSAYAQYFLESFSKAKPDFFNYKDLSEERLTRMIVMPGGEVVGLAANKQIGDKKLQDLVESLSEIKAD